MNISIRQRIYWSFFLFVLLFVANAVVSFITLDNNRKLSDYVSKVTNPSLRSLDDFKDLLITSKMYTTNWVFLRSNQDDKDALKRIHNIEYSTVKEKLKLLSQKWNDKKITDSLNKTYAAFEQLLEVEKTIMSLLEKFEDYDDPVAKLEAERLVEDELVPQTTTLMKALSGLFSYELNLRNQKNKELDQSFMNLRLVITFLAVTIIFLGIFLSLYMTRVIISPINKIRHIVNDMGNGIIRKANHTNSKDEIGRMIRSVNNLSGKLQGTAAFAAEIGNRNFDSYFEPLSTEDTLGKALVAMRDNLKTSEMQLVDVNRELNMLFNSIDEIFFSVNMITLKVIQVSATCEKVYGYTQAEFLADYRLWFNLIHPDDKHFIENEEAIMKRGEQVNNQYRIIRKDKMIRWVETKITPTLDEKGKLVRVDGVSRDITVRKNAEADLHKSEQRYKQIVETAQEGIWLIDENSYTTFVNKKMCEMLEYSQEEIIGKHNYYFKNDEEKKKAAEQIQRRKLGISETYDSKFITKSGNTLWTSVSTNPVFGDDGIYKGAMAMFTDITKRKHDEDLLRKSQEKLAINNRELAQKNKELEQFAYVASHDLQEPLRTTISFVEIFKQQYYGKLDSKADTYLTYIMQASDRMRALIKDLLDFSRIGSNKDLDLVNCNIIIRDVIADINKAITDSNAVIISDDLPVISGYPTEIKQLFQNLTLNAIKFRKPDTIPQINISAKMTGDHWHFSFADNGIGIDKIHNERIFIIFQRLHTRTEYEGSGIGLSHCKKIVELHHGKLWVESMAGQGSVFHFTIPK